MLLRMTSSAVARALKRQLFFYYILGQKKFKLLENQSSLYIFHCSSELEFLDLILSYMIHCFKSELACHAFVRALTSSVHV